MTQAAAQMMLVSSQKSSSGQYSYRKHLCALRWNICCKEMSNKPLQDKSQKWIKSHLSYTRTERTLPFFILLVRHNNLYPPLQINEKVKHCLDLLWRELLEQGSVMGKSIQLGKLQNSGGMVHRCLQRSCSLMSPDAKKCFNIKKNTQDQVIWELPKLLKINT